MYEGELAPTRPRNPLANWTSVHLGNNPNRPTVDEIARRQLQLNMFSDNNTDNKDMMAMTIGHQMKWKTYKEILFTLMKMVPHQDQV